MMTSPCHDSRKNAKKKEYAPGAHGAAPGRFRLIHPKILNVGEPMRRIHAVCLALAFAFALSATDLFAQGPGDTPPPPPAGETVIQVLPPGPPAHGMTLCEFAAIFKPAPGHYEVYLQHPCKECPIKVCFTLPCGCPKVCATKRELVFDYGCCEKVKIRMTLFGDARVVYRHVTI
jgi:hypothetical protein